MINNLKRCLVFIFCIPFLLPFMAQGALMLLGSMAYVETELAFPPPAKVCESQDSHKIPLPERAQCLRSQLRQRYKLIVNSNHINTFMKGEDVTDIINHYIPKGTKFQDADLLLRVAGFEVHYPNEDEKNRAKNNNRTATVGASLNISMESLFSRKDVYITMSPVDGNVFNVIGVVNAKIIGTYL